LETCATFKGALNRYAPSCPSKERPVVRRSANSPTLWGIRGLDPPGQDARLHGSQDGRRNAAKYTPSLRNGWTDKKNPEKLAR